MLASFKRFFEKFCPYLDKRWISIYNFKSSLSLFQRKDKKKARKGQAKSKQKRKIATSGFQDYRPF